MFIMKELLVWAAAPMLLEAPAKACLRMLYDFLIMSLLTG